MLKLDKRARADNALARLLMLVSLYMEKVTNISITTGTFVRILVVGAVAYALWLLRDLALLVITAIVIASAIEPGVEMFMKYKLPRILAVVVMYLAVFGSLFAIFFFLAPPIVEDLRGFVVSAPSHLATLDLPPSVQNYVDASAVSFQSDSLLDALFTLPSALSHASGEALQIASGFFGGLFALVLVIVLSFYFAIQETGVEQFLRLVAPQKHEDYVVGLWQRAKKKIGLWMQGQLVLSLIVGVIVYLGLLLLGVPYALLLAIIAALFDLIPIFGSVVAGLVGTAIAFAVGGPTLAFFAAGLYFIVNQLEAHLIYPLVVNKVVGIPPLMVILALIAGGALAGFLGILLAIPVAAALREFLDDVDRGKRARESIA